MRSQIFSRNCKTVLSHCLMPHHLITDGSTISGRQLNITAAF
uniref:Uncharacterized protein n=1 Tax=Siphoviridae sp. ctm8l1 TaxID=2827930 RepID=A0A8S5T3W5_9CAUD|nr:MAG TPA: hypothetical protein [Siphoviridae sp. ctm8l1]